MTLEEVLSTECIGMTSEQALAHVKHKTVDVIGMARGADISGVLLKYGLLALVKDQANLTDINTQLRNICIALEDRFKPDGEIDLLSNGFVIDLFLGDATVVSILTAQGLVASDVKDEVMLLGTTTEPEFLDVTIKDVMTIVEPTLVISSEAVNASALTPNRYHDLALVVTGNVPTPTYANILIRHSNEESWKRVAGFANITQADTYYLRLPNEFIKTGTQIKCQCAYNIAMSLTAMAV